MMPEPETNQPSISSSTRCCMDPKTNQPAFNYVYNYFSHPATTNVVKEYI